MSLDTYHNPVAKLLTYGDCHEMDLHDWHNYPETVGLTVENVPERICMATDQCCGNWTTIGWKSGHRSMQWRSLLLEIAIALPKGRRYPGQSKRSP